MLVLIIAIVSGFLAGVVANGLGKARPYFHDDYHFTACNYKSQV